MILATVRDNEGRVWWLHSVTFC